MTAQVATLGISTCGTNTGSLILIRQRTLHNLQLLRQNKKKKKKKKMWTVVAIHSSVTDHLFSHILFIKYQVITK